MCDVDTLTSSPHIDAMHSHEIQRSTSSANALWMRARVHMCGHPFFEGATPKLTAMVVQ